jgi:2-dehydropantoate 2-reductase
MRAPVGDIVAAGGTGLATALLDECAAIATARGFAPSEAFLQQSRAMLTALGSVLTASMLRDLERGGRTEVEHLLGDMLRRKTVAGTFSLLQTAYVHVSAYEIRRAREAAP